jgi:thioredoxin 1
MFDRVSNPGMSRVVELNPSNFETALKNSKKIFVDFWAPYCKPCLKMNPVIDRISNKYESMVFAKVNVEKYGVLASRYHIFSLPAYVIFNDAKPSQSKIGAVSETDLEEFVSSNARQ